MPWRQGEPVYKKTRPPPPSTSDLVLLPPQSTPNLDWIRYPNLSEPKPLTTINWCCVVIKPAAIWAPNVPKISPISAQHSQFMQNGVEDIHPRGSEGPVPPAAPDHGQWPSGLSNEPYLLTADEVVQELRTDPDYGLSDQEAQSRLTQFGPNALLGAQGVSAGRILVKQIFNAMVLVSHLQSCPISGNLNLFATGAYICYGCDICNQYMDRGWCGYCSGCGKHRCGFLPGIQCREDYGFSTLVVLTHGQCYPRRSNKSGSLCGPRPR